ncbi:hypothetical protein CL630_00035 [bacterium]|nr:hypothetical protein [bacterium]|tara:strand:+ start:1721 stop:2398 length:678 start_codon:yes stop_codon:yes gene_type:complete
MQAVILAAGKGTRLRPLTHKIPKTLIPVAGKPILEHTLHALPKRIKEVVLVIGYKGDCIKRRLGDIFEGRSIIYAYQAKPNGTADALLTVRPFLKDTPFLLLYGDDLYNADDLELCAQKYPSVLVAHSSSPERFGVCIIKNGRLHGIIEKPENPPSNLINTGAYVLDHDIFDFSATVLPNGELNLAEQVGKYVQKKNVYVHKARSWYPVNNYEELKHAENALKSI